MTDLVTENACVMYAPVHEYVTVKCRGFHSYDSLVNITEYAFEMLQYYNVSKCIIDLQESKNHPHGGEEYLRDIWYPKMAVAGVCRIAFVVSADIFGRASMMVVHAGAAYQEN